MDFNTENKNNVDFEKQSKKFVDYYKDPTYREQHLKYCSEKIPCKNCEKPISRSNMKKHYVICMDKTVCAICNKHVCNEKLERHLAKHNIVSKKNDVDLVVMYNNLLKEVELLKSKMEENNK